MIFYEDNKIGVAFGASLVDVQQWLADTPRKWKSRYSESNSAEDRWDRSAGYAGALRLARDGWSEGSALIQTDGLEVNADAMLKHIVMDFAGHMPDVARFIAGEPRHMQRHKRVETRTAHLVVNISASGSVRSEAFVKYGKAVMAVIDNLEASGVRVELDAIFCSALCNRKSIKVAVGWKVKRAADTLDQAALAFSVAHPAALRRIGFAMCERFSPEHDDHGGYGYPSNDMTAHLSYIDAENATIIPGIGLTTGITVEEATALLNKHLTAAGITMENKYD